MVAKKISKKKLNIIIFGGSGFLGSHVAEVLHAQGHKVIIADIKKPIDIKKLLAILLPCLVVSFAFIGFLVARYHIIS